ncbi:MAG: hypothetical protein K8T10_00755 [Candidatus Eremiobacteraeota bacterium]|nr:hypothetical protein [Candidatus Eremiobacteraeota bacterium]
MKKDVIVRLNKSFEDAAYEEQGVEYWLARELQELLDYKEWRNFERVIEKAKIACQNSKIENSNHFVDVNKMVQVGSGATREIDDIMLTRIPDLKQNGYWFDKQG